ncbi:hypothetical protein M9458_021936 [Cirrhinus mrigala]|uniref:Uncharacterized protein n=1 Tax=Cirrhinus mrigala TaxID=683832 RepID=A0ABD0Q8U2_CIRMR
MYFPAYQWQATEWLDTCLPGLESPPRDQTPTPPPPPLPAPPPPLTPTRLGGTPTRLGGSVRLDGSTLSLQTGYPLRRYQGQRDFRTSLTLDDNNSPVYEEYRHPDHYDNASTVHPLGFSEGRSRSDYHHSSQYLLSHPPLLAWEERPRVWEDTHPFGSQQEIDRLGRISLRAQRLRSQSPKTSLVAKFSQQTPDQSRFGGVPLVKFASLNITLLGSLQPAEMKNNPRQTVDLAALLKMCADLSGMETSGL